MSNMNWQAVITELLKNANPNGLKLTQFDKNVRTIHLAKLSDRKFWATKEVKIFMTAKLN